MSRVRWFVGVVVLLLAGAAGSGLAQAQDGPPKPDMYRPRYHFTPTRNWMNDPNGLVWYKGQYNLFFQYNPYGDLWGHMNWGHAVSRDLVHWHLLPVAIPETDVMAFSGSAVVDWHDTSGLGKSGQPPLVALYTGFNPKTKIQAQYLAYSNDGGLAWTRYGDKPVLDIGSTEFRDPKVFWYAPGHHWVMAVVRATANQVAIYDSPNLIDWTLASVFGPAGARAREWECPDLYPMPVVGHPGETRWVLAVNLSNGAPAGSGAQYFVGSFDGKRFVPDPSWGSAPRWIDKGADFYASSTWNDIPASDGRRLLIGWADGHAYSQAIPGYPERGAMSLPRVLTLHRGADGFRLWQAPVRELQSLRADPRTASKLTLDGTPLDLSRWVTDGRSAELELDIDTGHARQILFTITDAKGYVTQIGANPAVNEIFVDRDRSGPHFSDAFGGRQVARVDMHDRHLRLHLFVDRSIIEVFADGGRTVMTERFFPGSEQLRWSASARGGKATVLHLRVWRMKAYRRHGLGDGEPEAAATTH
ncbi:glycoside hydrolase family 32 protein [Dyella sp. A6]|uniref:glycoside hydrolase family 32 protein n=1 Tax=Dyella aluminiiresistens TaxID=3069105 RepID=UPI002E7A6C87|nr:glycoside hydrolase family 32 protein [Dyella sp. A6]